MMDFPDIAEKYRQKYQWLLVDEYQDINYAQYQLIRLLAPNRDANLCVIGDPDQAIYGFRGADVKFIKDFTNDYPNAVVYKLQKSYRCSDRILQASSQVIGNISESMLTGLKSGIKINISENATDKSEAEFVARTIEKMMGGLRFFSIDSQVADGDRKSEIESLSDFAVLCRINRQMDALEKAFVDHSIPYQKIANEPFFQQKPINSIIDFLKLSINPQNAFIMDKLMKKFNISPEQFREVVSPQRRKDAKIIIGKEHYFKFYTKKTMVKQLSIVGITDFANKLRDITVSKAVELIVDNYFRDEVDIALLKQLLNITDDFGKDIEGFIRYTVLGSGIDTYRPDLETVTLMTIHSAKGLEFKSVFIIGCEDGLLPYTIFKQDTNLEEERRLFYVGMTRAEKFLFLTYAKKRVLFGREFNLDKSPYLTRIEKELIESSKSEYKKKPKKKKDDSQEILF